MKALTLATAAISAAMGTAFAGIGFDPAPRNYFRRIHRPHHGAKECAKRYEEVVNHRSGHSTIRRV